MSINIRSIQTSNSFCVAEPPLVPKHKAELGTIIADTKIGPQRITIGRSSFGFTAAAKIHGTVWFDTGKTGIEALLALSDRLQEDLS